MSAPEDEDEDEDEELEDGSGNQEEDEDMDDADGKDEEDSDASLNASDSRSAKIRELMKDSKQSADAAQVREAFNDSKPLATSLVAAAHSDAAKGAAIKTQRKTFDSLLNTRIRLQKALIATNSMAAEAHVNEEAPADSIEAAEQAALTLLNNLADLRASLDEARAGQKRKRTLFTSATPSDSIWESIQASESAAAHHRKTTLERWSAKTRGVSATASKGRLNASAQQTLTEVLRSQLADPAHLITRTQTPRSCAPLQSAAPKPGPDPGIFDDADFYGLLLKELLEQRSADLATSGTAEFIVQAPWQVAREAKTRKVVDTKASKGRRLRYTVHEKLQNFMAPEPRGNWGERQRDELFGSLFGRRLGLGEHDEAESEDEPEGGDAEEQGLMLFRN